MRECNRTPDFEADLIEIWEYIGADNPDAADRLLDIIGEKCNRLREYPDMGSPRLDLGQDIRSITIGSYIVFYRATDDSVHFLRILHGARDIGPFFP